MKSPFTGAEATLQQEWLDMTYRRESFRVLFHTYRCPDTSNSFEDESLSALNYNQLVNQYRAKHALPFPEKITAIRTKYGVSAARMSELLGLGTNGYRLYEDGEVPSLSNGKLIQLADDPKEFKRLVELCNSINDKAKIKLFQRIEDLIELERNLKPQKEVESYLFGAKKPDSITGFTHPNLNKLAEMVVFFAERMQPWKTKLNKLLFYTDFTMYRQTGFSMSGATYRAIPMGPVPNNFNSLYDFMANNGLIDIQCTTFPDGSIGDRFFATKQKPFSQQYFSKKELEVLNEVANRLQGLNTQDIIELSHQEAAWIENEGERKLIDYRYGFGLKGV